METLALICSLISLAMSLATVWCVFDATAKLQRRIAAFEQLEEIRDTREKYSRRIAVAGVVGLASIAIMRKIMKRDG